MPHVSGSDGVSLSLACSSRQSGGPVFGTVLLRSFRLLPPMIAKATGIKVCYTKRLTFLRVNIRSEGVFTETKLKWYFIMEETDLFQE